MLIASVLEFIIGNTLPGVAFGTYGMDRPVVLLFCFASLTCKTGGFWVAQAITYTPFYNAVAFYEPNNPANPGFHNSFGMAPRCPIDKLRRKLIFLNWQRLPSSSWPFRHLYS